MVKRHSIALLAALGAIIVLAGSATAVDPSLEASPEPGLEASAEPSPAPSLEATPTPLPSPTPDESYRLNGVIRNGGGPSATYRLEEGVGFPSEGRINVVDRYRTTFTTDEAGRFSVALVRPRWPGMAIGILIIDETSIVRGVDDHGCITETANGATLTVPGDALPDEVEITLTRLESGLCGALDDPAPAAVTPPATETVVATANGRPAPPLLAVLVGLFGSAAGLLVLGRRRGRSGSPG